MRIPIMHCQNEICDFEEEGSWAGNFTERNNRIFAQIFHLRGREGLYINVIILLVSFIE